MAKGKNVFTTGDVAKICNVAPRTVSKWFDSGQLTGYRIPGSKDRRIPAAELIRFMEEHNIPTTELQSSKRRILIIDSSIGATSALARALKSKSDYEVQTVQSSFEAGMVTGKFAPDILLVNLMSSYVDATDICKSIRAREELQATKIIALANQLSESEATALLQKGFDSYIPEPYDVDEIIDHIEQAAAIAC